MKEQVAKWLRNIPGITDVSPVTVAIGKSTWEGAVYTQRNERRYYLVGKRPHAKGPETCYLFAPDPRDWYVAGWVQNYDELPPVQQNYHPFGNHFLLKVWAVIRRRPTHRWRWAEVEIG